MKIAVACQDRSLLEPVASCLGEAAWLLVFDSVTGQWAEIAHRAADAECNDAGIRAAQLLRQAGAGAIIAGQFGDSALRVLRSAHFCLNTAKNMTAAQAVIGFIDGQLHDV